MNCLCLFSILVCDWFGNLMLSTMRLMSLLVSLRWIQQNVKFRFGVCVSPQLSSAILVQPHSSLQRSARFHLIHLSFQMRTAIPPPVSHRSGALSFWARHPCFGEMWVSADKTKCFSAVVVMTLRAEIRLKHWNFRIKSGTFRLLSRNKVADQTRC